MTRGIQGWPILDWSDKRHPWAGETRTLMELRRKEWEKKHPGNELVMNSSCESGVPEIAIMSVGFGRVRTIHLHPTDYVWALYQGIPEVAHMLSRAWMEWRIEQMAKQAIANINQPTPTEYEEMGFDEDNRPFWELTLFSNEFIPEAVTFPNNKTTVRVTS